MKATIVYAEAPAKGIVIEMSADEVHRVQQFAKLHQLQVDSMGKYEHNVIKSSSTAYDLIRAVMEVDLRSNRG